ncbi:MAG: hypothetical protein ACFFDB_00485 [Promethearchaeota archaeon]
MSENENKLKFKFGKIKALGTDYILYNSKDLPMGKIERSKGVYRFSAFDDLLIHTEVWSEVKKIISQLNSRLEINE